jgi:hypothetical protein
MEENNTTLIVLALLSVGVGIGIVLSIIWRIINKTPILKRASIQIPDVILVLAVISAIISRAFLGVNGAIKYNLIVAIGAGLSSALFFLIIKEDRAK